MAIHCNTSFGKLKEVIVGRELEISTRSVDLTFNNFFKENIESGIFNSIYESYRINKDILQKRIFLLDLLADILKQLGVNVHRPKQMTSMVKLKTLTYTTEASPANNVRDLTLVYNDSIVETPIFVRSRIFENLQLVDIFKECFDNGKNGRWIKAPTTSLTVQTCDLQDWRNKRDFDNIDNRYEMAIDAANFLTIGKDVIVNVTTYNQELGYRWIKTLFPESTFHVIRCLDNHIDGALVCLKPGVFLLNPLHKDIYDALPDKFKKWKFIIPDVLTYEDNIKDMTNIGIQLASSEGMDINVLSIDENTVLVNKRAINVIKKLEENHFSVIPVELDNGEIFGGGIHCSTLDLVREDEYLQY